VQNFADVRRAVTKLLAIVTLKYSTDHQTVIDLHYFTGTSLENSEK